MPLRLAGGSIEVLGQDPWTMDPEQRRRVGYLSDKDFPFPHCNLHWAADFMARFYPSWDKGYFETLVEELGIESRAPFSTLSRGGQRKFSLALTLVPRPEMLLLDEPAAGLDVSVRRAFLGEHHAPADGAEDDRPVLESHLQRCRAHG